jgi:acetyl coenzyme A synthetase (ADP forming)-like protein
MLDAFFSPRGIAVVGASTDPHKLGYGVVRNLVEYHYRGPIYPINPSARELLGYRCYPSVSAVPDPVDLAVVIVPAALVVEMVEECGERGIKNAIVVSGGFAETGEEGLEREKALAAAAKRNGMRLIGPNCIGTIDTHTPVNTTFVIGMPEAGDIGFVSQSGAMCAVVIDWARGASVGFSRIVSLGNQVDVNETEMIASLASDSRTRVITAYIEGVSNGRGFMDVVSSAARTKPVLVLKAGRGESGARAVASHTGALAGSVEAYEAAFHDSGVMKATSMEQLFDWARAFAWQPLPEGNRIAVLTNAGGPGILAVDALEAAGLKLAPLTDATKQYLRPRLPAAGSLDNPVDILAGSGPGTYAVALDALLSDPTVDAALVIQAPQDWFLPTSLAEVVSEVAAAHHKPVFTSIMGLASVDKALEILHSKRVPNFAFPERAASAIAAMVARKLWLESPARSAVTVADVNHTAATHALSLKDFNEVLAAYGIQVAQGTHAHSGDEAARIAEKMGFPVVLKIVSSGISHKSDVGGVRLNLGHAAAVREAFEEMGRAVRARFPDVRMDGVLVQKMYLSGHELIVGAKRDPQFGPLILVGSGGVEVELLRDIATGITPITRERAFQMLDETRAGLRLKGWRGKSPGDREAVVDAIVRLSQIMSDFPEIIELEVNPLLVMEHGVVALDVRGQVTD